MIDARYLGVSIAAGVAIAAAIIGLSFLTTPQPFSPCANGQAVWVRVGAPGLPNRLMFKDGTTSCAFGDAGCIEKFNAIVDAPGGFLIPFIQGGRKDCE